MTRCVPMIGLVLGDGRGLVSALQNSNSSKFLKGRRKFFCSSGHDPVQVDWVLGNVNLNKKSKNRERDSSYLIKKSFRCIVLEDVFGGIILAP